MPESNQQGKRLVIRLNKGADYQTTVTITTEASLAEETVEGLITIPGSVTTYPVVISAGANLNQKTISIPRATTSVLPPVSHYCVWWTQSGRKRVLMSGPIFCDTTAVIP